MKNSISSDDENIHHSNSPPSYLINRKKIPKKTKNNKKEKKRKKEKLSKKMKKQEEINECDDLTFESQTKFLNELAAMMVTEDKPAYKSEIIPHPLIFDPKQDSALFLGKSQFGDYVGKKDSVDGHTLITGASGAGKTANTARNTFETWKGTIFAFDLKGDLISQANIRKSKILYLMPEHQNQYYIDPFEFIRRDGERNLVQNCRSLAFAIIPLSLDEKDPFWTISARNILTGALVYFFRLNVSFIQAIIVIKTRKISKLLKKISSDPIAATCIDCKLKKAEKVLCSVNAVLQNYIIPFATDVVIQEALSSDGDSHKELIKWEDLDNQDECSQSTFTKFKSLEDRINESKKAVKEAESERKKKKKETKPKQ